MEQKPIKKTIMETLRTTLNNLVETMNRYDLYQSGDEVGLALKQLSDKVDETYSRIECVINTNKDIRGILSIYTDVMSDDDSEILERSVNDINIATDFTDEEPLTEDWYGMFHDVKVDTMELSLGGIPYKSCQSCAIREEQNVMNFVDGVCLCNDCLDERKPTEDTVELSGGGIPYRVCYHCSIKEEETVMGQVNGFWLCCDCNDETKEEESVFELDTSKFLPSTFDKVKQVIEILKTIDNGSCIDGETMDHIVKELGFEEYLLRSLVMKSSFKETKDLLREKFEIEL